MFYFMPVWYFPIENHQEQQIQLRQSQEVCEDDQIQDAVECQNKILKEQWEKYLNVFEEELQILDQKQKKKIWKNQEDGLLVKMREQDFDWKTIASKIQGTNSQICRRRYFRIRQLVVRWPKKIDEEIKYLCQVKKLKWAKIVNELSNKYEYANKYTGKMVKQRYEFYLRDGIQKKDWTIEEDIKLIKFVSIHGTCWKNIIKNFQGRTELQLKNRYNGTLKLVEKRVIAKIEKKNSFKKQEDRSKSQFIE